MIFRICKQDEKIFYRRNVVQLQCCDSEDSVLRISFVTTYYDNIGRPQQLGVLLIGKKGMTAGTITDHLPQEFSSLPQCFFSLGQDEEYYEKINHLKTISPTDLFVALRDMAYDPDILDDNRSEDILKHRMLRGIATKEKAALSKIRGQFHRMAHGSAKLTAYSFSYTAPAPEDKLTPPPTLEFMVTPESNPPTNIHALIGRNGCGKTHLIRNMVRCLQKNSDDFGTIKELNGGQDVADLRKLFVNVLCIAFSPFDDFSNLKLRGAQLPMTYVGLHRNTETGKRRDKEAESLKDRIWRDFWTHFKNCMITARKRQLWHDAVETLKSDSLFSESRIDSFSDGINNYPEKEIPSKKRAHIRSIFDGLSSGHKIVLLIITSCVAEIEERSVLFLDEPETHLHPPLLSALIRALSDLLRDRNGVAIIATHSPVVLQEIPKSCVYLLTRHGPTYVEAEHQDRETFGTSFSTLIDDVFGLEVRNSGFHKMMQEAAEQHDSFEDVLKEYRGQIGDEAIFLLRMLMRRKQWKEQ